VSRRERALRDGLSRTRLPGEDEARERSWSVIAAAFAERPARASRRSGLRPVLVLAAVLAAAALAVSPPGVALGTSVLHSVLLDRLTTLRVEPPRLPGSGRILASSSRGTWIVRPDGRRTRLGAFTSASWSPHGLYVLARRGNVLRAVDPGTGQLRWPGWLGTGGPVRAAAWSRGDGWRVAYIVDGQLRVANGDGTGDHALATAARPLALAWRPLGAGHRLHEIAYAAGGGRLALVEVGGAGQPARVLWRRRLAGPVTALAWSGGGTRLAVLGPRGVRLLDQHGRPRGVLPLPGATQVAFAPGGTRLAVTIRPPRSRQTALVVVDASRPAGPPRTLYAGLGPITSAAWSPDGRWIALAAPADDAWILVPAAGGRVRFAQPASSLYGGGAFPQIGGWSR
jgi:hypothetical protein